MHLLVCENCGAAFESKKKKKHCSEQCRRKSQVEKNKRRTIKQCKNCGKSFEARNHRLIQEYCSVKCAGSLNMGKSPTNKKEPLVKICEVCKKEYKVVPSNIKSRFCSFECKTKGQIGKKFIIVKRVKTTCLYCNKEFEVTPLSKKTRKYCSHECYYAYMKSLTGSSKHPYYNKVECVCINCGKAFLTKPAKVKYGEGKFCSRNCQGAHMVANANKQDTKIEIILEVVLTELSLVYEKQKPIGWYVCDFYIPKYNLVIEADGDYWHRIEKVKKRDKRKNSYLLRKGYKLLRIWESDIHKNPKEIIIEYIKRLTA